MHSYNGASSALRAMILAIVFASMSMVMAAAPAAADTHTHTSTNPHWCQCVQYIKHSYQLTGAVGNAKDMGPGLTRRGFRRLPSPVVGAVVIFQPAFGFNQTYGHVGRIIAVSDLGSQWQITVRSANAGGRRTIRGCTNMNDLRLRPYPRALRSVSYYTR